MLVENNHTALAALLEFAELQGCNEHDQTVIVPLGWQLPQVMPDYPSVTLYYPFWGGNVVTQI